VVEASHLFDDLPVAAALAPLEVHDVVLDPVFGRRRDALLRTIPIHDLVDRAERSDSGIAGFDIRALALAAFDVVIARQGFPHRTTPTQVIDLLAGIGAVQSPHATAETYMAAAEHVLNGLTNRRERERQFSPTSIVYADAGDGRVLATAVPRPFWLLREAEDLRTGEIYLEASADAVNALVGGLDIPIEDQQTALEIVLERQLARGELDAAHATAIKARQLTAGYLIQIEELLHDTERYLRGTDWNTYAPQLINNALDHLSECLAREGRLLEHVTGGVIDNAPETTTEKRTKISTTLTKLLSESRHLHTLLMDRLMGARGTFLDAQDGQMFRPILEAIEFDLGADLFEPTLGLRFDDAGQVADAYMRALLGPIPPVVLRWGDLIEALLRLPDDNHASEDGEPADEMEFRPDPEPLISYQVLIAAHDVLARVQLPIRLSTLLEACPDAHSAGATAYDLFVAASLRAFDNGQRDTGQYHQPGQWADEAYDAYQDSMASTDRSQKRVVHLLDVLGPDAACVADDRKLIGDGWAGNDLVICADRDQLDALLLGELPYPEPTPLRTRVRIGGIS
jgi:hypothetical protein